MAWELLPLSVCTGVGHNAYLRSHSFSFVLCSDRTVRIWKARGVQDSQMSDSGDAGDDGACA